MMAESKDSVFTLEDATIKFDPSLDQRFISDEDSLVKAELDTIYINAKIRLNNIVFEENIIKRQQPVFLMIKFQEEVSIREAYVSSYLAFVDCTFESEFRIAIDKSSIDNNIYVQNSIFRGYVYFELTKGNILSQKCLFDPVNKRRLNHNIFYTNHNESFVLLAENRFVKRDSIGQTKIFGRLYSLRLWDNTFESDLLFSELSIEDITMIRNNFIGLIDMTNVEFGSYKSELYYDQLGGKIGVYSNEDNAGKTWRPQSYEAFSDSIAAERFFNVYRNLTEHFKSRGNIRDFNKMYVEMKDFETMQLQYFSEKDKSMAALFSWKMNQLLGVISDYGTRPTKSIIYSIYVILIFTLIYIFFPNSWDTEGRKRLIDRYTFFLKYLRKDAGIHEVYLENKQENLMQYKDFKSLIHASDKKVPKFFTATALPIYKWAVSGTNLSAAFLRKFDIIKGRWEDLPQSKRIWKSFLITGAFIVAIIYDLFIKALNALMLSVNAFTTLGFGEIPIKGVPRYLAILQGFIGWFMLTIFSVSLISQLLN
jgi:hypothetical protein